MTDSGASQRTLVVITGPPAVGKMAVGSELSALTGIPMFHNHLSIEAVLPVFDFGTEPFNRLVGAFRTHMFNEAADSDLPGLIFTYVWAFDNPGDERYVQKLMSIFEERGCRTVFAELYAPQEVRLQRNNSPDRLASKASKRDVAASNARLMEADRKYRLSSDGDFPFDHHFFIDNSDLSPRETAEAIAEHFSLPRASSSPEPSSADVADPVVRPAASADRDRLVALSEKTIRHSYAPFMGEDAVEGYIASGAIDGYVAESLDRCLVIERQGSAVGYCVWEGDLIDLMMVEAGMHGEGLGSRLLHEVERRLFESFDVLRLESFVANEVANAFYDKHGWIEARRYADEESGVDKILFTKRK